VRPTPVRVWTDPSCPWAWQAAKWLIGLRDRDFISLTWSLFSLEVNSSPPGTPFHIAASRHGRSLAALALARREGREEAFERLYITLGVLMHEDRELTPDDLVPRAAADAGMPGLPERAAAIPDLAEEIVWEYGDARRLNVFGVPTLMIDDDRVVYGPIVALAPIDEDAVALWNDVRHFSAREDLFELKRWPRHIRPGESPSIRGNP
jgi:predicted DsbA family dithiol-disulfide isomerase